LLKVCNLCYFVFSIFRFSFGKWCFRKY